MCQYTKNTKEGVLRMTQELYKSKETIRKEKAKKLKEYAMKLWRNNAEEYRTLLDKYHELLEKKKRAGINPLKKLKVDVIQSYPEIPFLDMDEEEAKACVEKWEKQGRLQKEVDLLEEILKTNNAMNSIKAWNRDCAYTLSLREYKDQKNRKLYPHRYTEEVTSN